MKSRLLPRRRALLLLHAFSRDADKDDSDVSDDGDDRDVGYDFDDDNGGANLHP